MAPAQVAAVGDHLAPGDLARFHAEADEGEDGLDDDGDAHLLRAIGLVQHEPGVVAAGHKGIHVRAQVAAQDRVHGGDDDVPPLERVTAVGAR